MIGVEREAVADRLAEIGELRRPTRDETREFLIEVLVSAVGQIPVGIAPWSWGEFHNSGLQPLYDISDAKDWPRLGVCAMDLGLGEQSRQGRNGEALSPLHALAGNLTDATERLLDAVRGLLEGAGISPRPPAKPPTP